MTLTLDCNHDICTLLWFVAFHHSLCYDWCFDWNYVIFGISHWTDGMDPRFDWFVSVLCHRHPIWNTRLAGCRQVKLQMKKWWIDWGKKFWWWFSYHLDEIFRIASDKFCLIKTADDNILAGGDEVLIIDYLKYFSQQNLARRLLWI